VIHLYGDGSVGLPNGSISTEQLREMGTGSDFKVGGCRYYLFRCSMHDYVLEGMERSTQIVYPKDAGYILLQLDVFPGKRVGEAGAGSGALTTVFSRAVGSEGRVYAYKREERLLKIIRKNLAGASMFDNVTVHHRDAEDGIEERDLDAFFLDLKHPLPVLDQVYQALAPGGFLCVFCPITNQVSVLMKRTAERRFLVTEVSETSLRKYKLNPDRLRPMDRMVAHTGYLLFAVKRRPECSQTEPVQADAQSIRPEA
jgi:tRNA (adenine57-N1/adenine58-N1)-methyltransferase